MMPLKKKICFVVSSPSTAKVFLLKHFQYLSEKFDIYLVANCEENFNTSKTIKFLINFSLGIKKDKPATAKVIKILIAVLIS